MVPITCQMKECLNRTSNRTFMSFLEYWSGQRFSSLLDPRIGWDGWGCGVMASETEWFSIMPESKRREGSVWEMTKVGNADHVKLIQRALLLQAWSARIGQKKKKKSPTPPATKSPKRQWHRQELLPQELSSSYRLFRCTHISAQLFSSGHGPSAARVQFWAWNTAAVMQTEQALIGYLYCKLCCIPTPQQKLMQKVTVVVVQSCLVDDIVLAGIAGFYRNDARYLQSSVLMYC